MKYRFCHRFLVGMLFAGALAAHANPTGGAVAAGSAGIAGQGTSTVTINQASNTAIINWQTFSIGAGELTKFIQPSSSSAALNRVLGGQTSIIDGTLSANGQVYLLNGNGIVVGPGGVINTAGFTGSTRDISDADFLSGNLHFVGGGAAGVKNLGTINALGGNVVLIGKTVDNAGTINATGTAGLVAGDDVLLAQNNADGSTITVNPVSAPAAAPAQVGVRNTGTVTASRAELKAANGNIYALAIQNEGVVRATTLTRQGGHIYLTSDSGTIVNSGTLDASAATAGSQGGTILVKNTGGRVVHSGAILARGGQGGAGGNAEISSAQVGFTGTIDLTAPGGTTGNLLLDPATLTVVAGTGGNVTVITPGNDQNGPTSDMIGATTVDNILTNANLTLNADTNVTVASAISWNAATTLKLSTNTGGSSIAINAAITDSNASGGLTLATANAADPISATGAISVANFILQSGAWVQNVAPVPAAPAGQPANPSTGYSQLPGFTVTNGFEIQGGTFLRTSGGDGSSDHPYELVDIYGVQGMTGFLSSNANIGLNANGSTTIDASGTSTWNNGLGFIPIGFTTSTGSSFHSYTGTFGQTGGEIDNLTINQPNANHVGLFADMAGSLYYIDFSNANVTGNNNVGVMAGENDGTIFNASINGGSVTGQENVGFIAGDNDGDGGASIQYCYINSGTVTGTNEVGGMAGLNYGQIQSGSSGGTVNGVNEVGGIAGENDGTVDSTSGYAAVNGATMVGGVVGLNASGGTVTTVTGSATVTGSDVQAAGDNSALQSFAVGGLVGENDGSLVGSSTTTSSTVSGDTKVGGLVGLNTGTISNTSTSGSFNSGSVTGQDTTIQNDAGNMDIGGVVGLNTGTVMDSYNIGTVTGGTDVGGVAGENEQTETSGNNVDDDESFHPDSFSNQPVFSPAVIQTSYNGGTVAATGTSTAVGGIVGLNDSGATVTTCYNVGSIGSSSSTTVGGIVGDNYGSVTSTYNSGAVTGEGAAGLIGADENGASTTNSYWDVPTSGQVTATNAFGDLTEMHLVPLDVPQVYPSPYLASSYTYFEGNSGGPTLVTGTNGVYAMGTSPDSGGGPAWYIIDGQTRPLLAMEQSTNIQNAHQLQLMAEDLNNSYTISQNIDASGTTQAAEVWNFTNGFVPIGGDPSNENYAFAGSLNGENNTINGLFIDRPDTDDVGLFGYFSSTTNSLSSVVMTNATITGDNNVGAFVGANLGLVSYLQIGQSSNDTSTITAIGQDVGGIAGLNGTASEGLAGTVSESVNYATVRGGTGPASVGGLVGQNAATGIVTQSINFGAIGTSTSQNVGGLVGLNQGQVDDSYSTGGSVSGASNVGGLVGLNDDAGTLETSYSTTPVTGTASASTGALVGDNEGVARHSYWQTDNANAELPGIGTNNGQALDVAGYTAAQLTDMSHYAQGASPVLWDFSPQTGEGGGIWGINVYNYAGSINNGLPVLQWQTPVNTEVSVSGGTVPYGTTPTYVATGEGASSLTSYVNPNSGPTLTLSNPNDVDAGSVHQVTLSGNPIYSGYNVEYVNNALTYDGNGQQSGTTPAVTIVPANLTITAGNATISSSSAVPPFTATYGPFAYGQTPSDLNGTLGFTVSPALRTGVSSYAITPGGQSSSNYNIIYVPGTLTITGAVVTGSENQQVATVQSEITNIIDQFGTDPFNGLDPLYFMTIPTVVGMEGDFLGAINNEGKLTDFLYISSTSSLPSLSRLVTPGTGVVTIGDGFVVVGNPQTGAAIYLDRNPQGLPGGAIAGLQSVLSPAVYNELLALIYGHY